MKKTWWGFMVLVLVFSMALTACGGGNNTAKPATTNNSENNTNTTTEEKAEPTTPTESDSSDGYIEAADMSLNPPAAANRSDTMIIGMTDPKGVFNPLFMETAYDYYVNYTLFDSFIEVKTDGTYQNSLAEKVDISEDGLKYTYHLKPGVAFSDGTPMTVKDYYFTLKLYMDKSYDGQSDPLSWNIVGAKEYNEGKSNEITGVKIIDDQTIEISLTEYTALTPVELGGIYILPEHYYGKEYTQGKLDGVKKLNDKPLGSGQYKLVSYSPGQEVVFEANENYFRGAPKVKNLIFKTTTATTNLPMLQQGETDMEEGFTVTEDNVEALKAMGFVDISLLPNNGYGYIAFNHNLPKFQDVRVRQALVYGLNRKEIVAGIYGPYADVINIPQSSVSWSYTTENIETYDFDLEKAKQLLAEAGWKLNDKGIREKDGEVFKINFSATADNPVVEALLPIMTQNYKELGIEISAETLDFNAIMDKSNTGDFEMYFAAWGLTPDPDNTVYITDGSQNDLGYSNKKVDELMAKGKKTLDIEERKKIYKEMYQELNKDVPVILMYQRKNMLAINGRLDGFDVSPYKDFPFSLYQVQIAQ
ncbi:ABC transporter substrate-binding protein [Paenibacillus barengoltzii]|uniref:Peptide/nickel transport system substrate-binding protein n=1 Tax=Paenibacillus barengoltzii J12 TaxID=935846 RepID=A0ABY1M3J4_9BACL|nr:ABC transporter substrate-binding protein [Paenibacillus barengoltzii]SMF69223.1 peptide/nickel transport system substrate-binding protein [Paenibacillus barengoltzii J12]